MNRSDDPLLLGAAKPAARALRNHRQEWTSREDDYLASNNGEMTHAEMGAVLGRSPSAVQKRIHALGLQHRQLDDWSDDELEILRLQYPVAGAQGARSALAATGYVRTLASVSSKAQALQLGRLSEFEALCLLPQRKLYERLAGLYRDETGQELSYRMLATMCYVSYSRVQKWFAPGTGQAPLSTQMKHHFWLACKHAVALANRRDRYRKHADSKESGQ